MNAVTDEIVTVEIVGYSGRDPRVSFSYWFLVILLIYFEEEQGWWVAFAMMMKYIHKNPINQEKTPTKLHLTEVT